MLTVCAETLSFGEERNSSRVDTKPDGDRKVSCRVQVTRHLGRASWAEELIKGHLALVAAGIPVDPSDALIESRLLQRMTRKKRKSPTKHQLERG